MFSTNDRLIIIFVEATKKNTLTHTHTERKKLIIKCANLAHRHHNSHEKQRSASFINVFTMDSKEEKERATNGNE